ncbi:PREDICTED: class I histocompatibility antigen, F10 alpha chain-like [Gekko japonicus]|uniref:Class I histocompatibility antigen, F10 alpha chain-like n=1 Tax=Gekko japonicus TaxID=146911 RepID=A0ABM1KZI3_GEKJA|nr:PREDICTED: class I histocompatibility antigen, F10 alpha chain-like [Gekko japonicus]
MFWFWGKSSVAEVIFTIEFLPRYQSSPGCFLHCDDINSRNSQEVAKMKDQRQEDVIERAPADNKQRATGWLAQDQLQSGARRAAQRGVLEVRPCVPQAEILKQELGSFLALGHPQSEKDYLEETCVEWLRMYLEYGNETLLRTEPPMVRVAPKKGYDGRETLFCQLYGFYPKEINVTWLKDGEVRKRDTLTGGVVPNSDGTYHTWLSIDVDPKDRGYYQCRVEHDGLPGPLERVWEEPASNWGHVLGIPGGLAIVILVIRVILVIVICMSDTVQWSPDSTTWNPTSAGIPFSQTSSI